MKLHLKPKKIFTVVLIVVYANISLAGLHSPFNQQPKQWDDDIISKLQNLVSKLSLVDKIEKVPPINAAVDISSLKIPDTVNLLASDMKKIAAIEFIIHSTDFRLHTDQASRAKNTQTHVLCHFSTGEKKIFCIQPEHWCQWLEIVRDFPLYGGTYNAVFWYELIQQETVSREEHDRRLDSELERIKPQIPRYATNLLRQQRQVHFAHLMSFQQVRDELNYTKDVKSFYHWHRTQISRLLMAALTNNSHYYELARQKGTCLFCIGCGSGLDIDAASKGLRQAQLAVQSYGIEINPQLVEKGQKQYLDYNIIHGDALNSAQLILQEKSKFSFPPDAPTLVVAEGLLTREVLKGPYESLHVLHELIQEGVADIVVIGGLSSLTVNSEIATAAGWFATTVMLYPDETIHNRIKKHSSMLVLEKNSPAQQMSDIHARSIRRSRSGVFSILDLSLSGLPVLAVKHFLQQEGSRAIKHVDLSWSYLTTSQIDELIDLMAGFPSLTHVTVSGFEPWYEAFVKKIKSADFVTLIKRTDNLYPAELPSFEPHIARLFRQYTTLPNVLIFKPSRASP